MTNTTTMTETLRYHQARCAKGLAWISQNFPNIDAARLKAMDHYNMSASASDLLEMWDTAKDVLSANRVVREDVLAQSLRTIAGKVSTHEAGPGHVGRDLNASYNVARAYEAQQRLEKLELPFLGTAEDLYAF